MKLIKFMVGQTPSIVLVGMAAGVVSGLSHAALLALVNRALHLTPTGSLIGSFVGLLLLLPLARIGSSYGLTLLGQRAVLKLRLQMVRSMLHAPQIRLESLGSHRLIAALTEDAAAIVNTIRMVPLLLANLAIVLGGLAYLSWLSLPIFLVFLVFLAVGVVTYHVPVMKGNRIERRLRDEGDTLWSDLRGAIDGSKELKLHSRRRDALLKRIQDTGVRRGRLSLNALLYFQGAAGWGQVLVFGVIGLILFAPLSASPVGSQALTGYVLVVLYLTGPIEMLLNSVHALNGAHIALDKLQRLGFTLEQTDVTASAGSAVPLPAKTDPHALELVDVVHRYGGDDSESSFALGPLSLRIEPGEVLFVTGGNGSGKTTFAKVLTGLYVPEAGEIRLGGRPVTAGNRHEFLDRFSVIFSDFHLFDTLLGLDAPDLDARAQVWLQKLHLDRKVRVEGGRFSTTALSRGQRKRLALLTAYLEDRPIYVFDEWAADQDSGFKGVFYRELLPELAARGKIVVVISHDEHYYHVAHRIVKLEQGRIVSVDRTGEARLSRTQDSGTPAGEPVGAV